MTERTEENRQHRLLVIEDEPSIRTLLEATLSLTGYHVRSTDTGLAALAEAARLRPDLILLDIMLPDLDGYEVTRRLRKAGNLVPVLLLTARTGVDDRIQGLSIGADDYVTKPFNIEEVLLRIQAILRRTLGSEALLPDTVCATPTSNSTRGHTRCTGPVSTYSSHRPSSSCCPTSWTTPAGS